jgi:hypothetical protein
MAAPFATPTTTATVNAKIRTNIASGTKIEGRSFEPQFMAVPDTEWHPIPSRSDQDNLTLNCAGSWSTRLMIVRAFSTHCLA